jgi:ribosomal protein S8
MKALADMIAKIKTAYDNRRIYVPRVRNTKQVKAVLNCLVTAGFFDGLTIKRYYLSIKLKYADSGSPVFRDIILLSFPGVHNSVSLRQLRQGKLPSYTLISTNRYGIVTVDRAIAMNTGGKLLLSVQC